MPISINIETTGKKTFKNGLDTTKGATVALNETL
jgi:hypothetical protein